VLGFSRRGRIPEERLAIVIDEKLLDERLAALETARPWSPRLISKLESHIRSADDAALFRINPLAFAADKAMPEAETVDLFLHASALGLLEMNWILICPYCSCVMESFRALKNLESHCRCTICHIDLVATLDDYVAVAFTVSPSVRRIAYHEPERLSVEDYAYRVRSTGEGMLPDGTPFTVMKQRLSPALAFLMPGETTRLELTAESGLLRGWSTDADTGFLLAIDPDLPRRDQTVSMRCTDDACEPNSGTLAPGCITFEITHAGTRRQAFGVVMLPAGFELPPLHFAPFLSGKRLLTTQTFRDLFRSEVIRTSEGIGVNDITLLFTDLKGSTALYDRIGDLNAFALVQQHFERLQQVTNRHDGAVIKTIGDAVMAAFRTPRDAVGAALAMRGEIAAFNRSSVGKELILKIGLHKGAAIAVTLNERLDYFGQTVNIASRVQNLADANEIYLSEDVYEADGVAAQLAAFPVDQRTAHLRGVEQQLPVFRVASAASAA
jgi:class 3 adenylate cyclase